MAYNGQPKKNKDNVLYLVDPKRSTRFTFTKNAEIQRFER